MVFSNLRLSGWFFPSLWLISYLQSGFRELILEMTSIIMISGYNLCSSWRIFNSGDISLCPHAGIYFFRILFRSCLIKSRFCQTIPLSFYLCGRLVIAFLRVFIGLLGRCWITLSLNWPFICTWCILLMSDLSPKSPLFIPTSSHSSSNSQVNFHLLNDIAQS